jgi:hypothetical protein
VLGHRYTQIANRIDIAATFPSMTADGLSDPGLSYTPTPRQPWDVIQTGAQVWLPDPPAPPPRANARSWPQVVRRSERPQIVRAWGYRTEVSRAHR